LNFDKTVLILTKMLRNCYFFVQFLANKSSNIIENVFFLQNTAKTEQRFWKWKPSQH